MVLATRTIPCVAVRKDFLLLELLDAFVNGNTVLPSRFALGTSYSDILPHVDFELRIAPDERPARKIDVAPCVAEKSIVSLFVPVEQNALTWVD